MAKIQRDSDPDTERLLLPHQNIGRGAGCRIVDDDNFVSTSHAEIRWNGNRWWIQDLNSRNGTWVDGRRLAPGRPVPLTKGSRFAIGRPDNRWVLVCDTAPVAMAEAPDGSLVQSEDGILALPPDSDEPLLSIYRNHLGEWVVDAESGTRNVKSGEHIAAGDERWTLHLPDDQIQTMTRVDKVPTPSNVQLLLILDSDDSARDIHLLHEGRVMPVTSRASSNLLVRLAMARQADNKANGIDADEAGWLDQPQLQVEFDLTGNAFNVAVHRLRNVFSRAGLTESSGVIERRARSGQVRIGIADIIIDRG